MAHINLKALNEEILLLLEKHEIKPKVLSLSLVLPSDHFDAIAIDHPNYIHPGILQASHTDSELQWGVLIRREKNLV